MQNYTVTHSSYAVRLTLEPLSCYTHGSVIFIAHVVYLITEIEEKISLLFITNFTYTW